MGRAERLLRSPAGAVLARPWFDALALSLLRRFYFPLSRLWAAAQMADGSVNRFERSVPITPLGGLLRHRTARLLERFEEVSQQARDAEAAWQRQFFGADATVPEAERGVLDRERSERTRAAMQFRTRFGFLLAARRVPAVRWRIPGPAEVEAIYGAHLSAPEATYAVIRDGSHVERSRSLTGPGARTFWLRFPSPGDRVQDVAYARVFEPLGRVNPPTVIFGTGIAVEPDLWGGGIDTGFLLSQAGLRVIELTSPWHGRRAQPGQYGGEPVLATAPLGMLDLVTAQVRETAVLIDWARRTCDAPVGVAGLSLGALVAQLVATHARAWPVSFRPDAVLLVAHSGCLADIVLTGALAHALDAPDALAAAGWTAADLRVWAPLTDPCGEPGLPPAQIVSVIGRADNVTPFAGGREFVTRWRLPPENVFMKDQGHFSLPIGLLRDGRPLVRFRTLLES